MQPYTFHITLYDVAFFGAIFIGFTFFLLLWFSKKANQQANRFLAGALTVVVLGMVRVLAMDIRLDIYFPDWGRLPLQFSLAMGPLLYFYVLQITRPLYRFRSWDLLHFGPLALQMGVHVLAVIASVKTNTATYHTPIFQQFNPVLQLLALLSVAGYLCAGQMAIGKFYNEIKFSGSDRLRHSMQWLHRLILSLGALWVLWIALTALDYFYYDFQLTPAAYYPLHLLLAAMLIWMAGIAFLRSDVAKAANLGLVLKPLLPADLKQKGTWLKHTVKENRYYQDPDLSLASLAEKLEMHTHELSKILNTVLKKSFNDFVNELRVKAAARKMQDAAYNHITLLGIAFESGFNSQSTFNRIFKQITGKSPLEYKNEQKKEYPSYNLGSKPKVATVTLRAETDLNGWSQQKSNRNNMFKNYLKIARRNLLRNKSYAAINVAGLAVGIAVCIIIFIIIQFHTSFDDFHTKQDRIYRVLTEYHHEAAADVSYGKDVPFPLPRGVKGAFAQIQEVAPVYASQNDQLLITDQNGNTEKVFKEQRGVFFTEAAFFKMFDFPLLAGSYASLNNPNNVLLTKETAEKYFGDWRTAMGKTIKLQAGGFIFSHGTDVLKVSGILATIPANTDFQLKVVVSLESGSTKDMASSTNWEDRTGTDFGCYVLMPAGLLVHDFNRQLRAYSRKMEAPENKDTHIIQPLNEVHYDTRAGNYSNKTISRQLLNVLWLIAAFILLIACVNFINLATAQAVNRAKEVGVRKVLGSSKAQLQTQFIIEAFLIVTIAVILAAGITMFSLHSVNQLLELSLSFNILSNPVIILFLVVVTVVVTGLAGFYPSIVLSRFNPADALKSKLTSNTSGISLRRGLVVFQFIIAQALIIGTLNIVRQMNYFMDQPLGFDKEAIVNVPFRVDSLRISRLDYLKNQLMAVNGVQGVSYSSNTPVENGNDLWTSVKFNHAVKETDFKVITKFADTGYVSTYKLPLVAGRNLRPSNMTREFLVNESLVKSLGLKRPEDILNKEIAMWDDRIKCNVVGVLKDFHDRSFRSNLAPLVITTNVTMYNQAGIKLATNNLSSTMQGVKAVFEKTFPDFVYEDKFLDEKIANFYKQENQLAQLYKIFAAIAIFLSCLGLYGLASFMAVQRIKEVGIRKVMGASAGSIVYLFSKEFVVLIAIAFVIATPIAWYYMNQWLQDYVYRISISWWLFAAGGLAAIIIALVTISFQALKAALANPVKSLRNE